MMIKEVVEFVLFVVFVELLGLDFGYVYVFDMGDLIKIDDFVWCMIRLVGFKFGEDVEIKYIGF